MNRKSLEIIDSKIEGFVNKRPTMIFGSTYPIEHQVIPGLINDELAKYHVLIFPHNIDLKEIRHLKSSLNGEAILYSEFSDSTANNRERILIVDQIGLLKDAYRFARLAYIGGGFKGGIHNTLEPFVYKMPLIFGPKYDKFPEAKLLVKHQLAIVVENVEEIGNAITKLTEKEIGSEIDDVYTSLFNPSISVSSNIVKKVKEAL